MESKHFDLKLKQSIKNEFIVTSVTPVYLWVNSKPTSEISGWKLRTVCPSAQYAETTVKMEVDNPPLDADAIEKEPVLVAFDELEFTPYVATVNGKSTLAYSAKAKGLKVIKSNAN